MCHTWTGQSLEFSRVSRKIPLNKTATLLQKVGEAHMKQKQPIYFMCKKTTTKTN